MAVVSTYIAVPTCMAVVATYIAVATCMAVVSSTYMAVATYMAVVVRSRVNLHGDSRVDLHGGLCTRRPTGRSSHDLDGGRYCHKLVALPLKVVRKILWR